MSCFNEDRATFNEKATEFDKELSASGLDEALLKAFNDGMELDEIMYVVGVHTEKVVRRYIVQHQLKKAANKDKQVKKTIKKNAKTLALFGTV